MKDILNRAVVNLAPVWGGKSGNLWGKEPQK